MQTNNPNLFYQQQIAKHEAEEKKLVKNKSLFSLLRLVFIVLAIIALWKLWAVSITFAFITFTILTGAFIAIVIKDLKNKEVLENIRLLKKICREELRILSHDFLNLPDGQELCPAHHAYAQDLDIFGKNSLYQYINRTTSEQGHRRLASWLLNPSSIENILQRQEACVALCQKPDWGQQFRAYGITHPVTLPSEQKINDWKQDQRLLQNKSWLRIIRFLFPLITIISLLLFLFDIIPGSLFTFLIIAFFGIAASISKLFQQQYLRLNKIVPELETLEQSIRIIETHSFESVLFNRLKDNLGISKEAPSQSIKQLKKILERLDYRYNPIIYIPLNTFLLWDLQQIFLLEKWQLKFQHQIPSWFDTLAEAEALISLGTVTFNHPGWCFPKFNPDPSDFDSTEMGHPLIPISKRVNNTFSTHGARQINLVTGSNMAGKSTFLRSVGINIVLAMAGAPVCCKELTLSSMKVMSSMRVSDNLEENTSTFYAELKKLKEIIEAVRRQENVFILLDEILRGTNSADRHTGSMALLKQLIRENASCIVATHDLELSKLVTSYPGSFHNFHFDVQVKDEELFFDYKIKEGVCQSMNASLLMKKIGIEL
ncbi:MAG: hypothetical protein JST17_14575 [Bacteroidetes bacterium]|nr:hypothetical protein [Bacteroidota bacterium]MBS1930716.1 hypothetical protein [Bacteroidota bacterium]